MCDPLQYADAYKDEFESCLYNYDFMPDEWIDIRRDGLITEEQFEIVKEFYSWHYLFQ